MKNQNINEKKSIKAQLVYYDLKYLSKEIGNICLDLHCRSLKHSSKIIVKYLNWIQNGLNTKEILPNSNGYHIVLINCGKGN